DQDVFRANQVRNANVVHGPDTAGFFDHSEYQDAKKCGDDAIRRMILRHLNNTSVTVVLIGTFTWLRPWVRFEMAESVKRKNGLLACRIHHLKNGLGQVSTPGIVPSVPAGVEFPVFNWDPKRVASFATLIEIAGLRSDALKLPGATLATLLTGRRLPGR